MIGAVLGAPDACLATNTFAITMAITLVPEHGASRYTTESAQLDVVHQRAHVALSAVVGPGGLQLVSQGSVLYLSLPASKQAQLGGLRWIEVDTDSPAAAEGAAVGPIPDPLSLLAGLRGLTGRVRRIGSADLDGIKTIAYSGTIDLRAMANAVGSAGSSQVQALARLGGPRFPVEVWLDSKGLPRQIELTAGLGARGRIVVEVKFGDFGQPVLIGIPPESAVLHAPSVAAALQIVGP